MNPGIGHNNPPAEYYGSPKDIFLAFVVHVLTQKYEKLIGHTIAYFMDDEGNCSLTMKDLVDYSGIEDPRTLDKYIRSIERQKALHADRKRGRRNQYKMVADEIQKALQMSRVDIAKTNLSTEKEPTSHAGSFAKAPASHATTSDAVPTQDAPTSDVSTAGNVHTSHAGSSRKSHARANIDNNKYNNINNNNPHTTHASAREGRGNFENLGHNVKINCETVEHPEFVISIAAIEMQLALQQGPDRAREMAREVAKYWGISWGAEIEHGKKPLDKIIPNSIPAWMRSRGIREFLDQELGKTRISNQKPRNTGGIRGTAIPGLS